MNLPKVDNALYVDNSILKNWRDCQVACFYAHVRGYHPRVENVHLYWGRMYHKAQSILGTDDGWDLGAAIKYIDENYDEAKQLPDKGKTKERLKNAIATYWADSDNKEFFSNTRTLINEEVLSYRMFTLSNGTPVYYCGRIDKVVVNVRTSELYVIDFKHTSWNRLMDSQWELDPQFGGYVYLVEHSLRLKVTAFVLDLLMMQSKTENKFLNRRIDFPEWKLLEWERMRRIEINQLIGTPEEFLVNSPRCSDYNGCPYFVLCSNKPELRNEVASHCFDVSFWNPLSGEDADGV